ncbi:MAG: ribonuclease R [Desulfobulbaceae bacterium]|nr:ribonuclease R [Desulfobulbaceae bacterium]
MPRHQRPPRRVKTGKRRPEQRPAAPARQPRRQGHRAQPDTPRPLSMEDQLLLLLHGQGGSAERQDFARGLKPAARGEQRKLDKLLDHFCRSGLLACDGETYTLRPGPELFEATFNANPRGFGFVTPVDAPTFGRENDVFIPAPYLGSAAHGDRVLVRVEEPRRERPEGRIIKVLNRGATQVVGIYRLGRVFPEDQRFTYRVEVNPDSVSRQDEGKVVLAEITDFNSDPLHPKGRVVKVLGDPDDPAIQAEIVISAHHLPNQFSAAALAEAAALVPAIQPGADRLDLREIPHVTIDGETAQDFDDAVAISEIPAGYRLHVSIADVSHYVTPGSPLDEEAYQRGTSIYFPGRVVPMLPERLSNDLCSLVPDQDRLAFTAILDFDPEGTLINKKFTRAVIRSHFRFTYNLVQEILDATPKAKVRSQHKQFVASLQSMAKLAAALEKRRSKRGSIGFELPEADIRLDASGAIASVSRTHRLQAHKLIEEFMLAANEAVAATFTKAAKAARRDFLYRIHEQPDPMKVENFVQFARTIGVALGRDPGTPKWFAKIIDSVHGTPREYVISNLLLRTMQQARYAPENVGHFGLAATDYCHFTSPIRRYPDLLVHRSLARLLTPKGAGRGKPFYSSAEEAGLFLSDRERKAVTAEREVTERLQVRYMAKHLGEEFEGIVSGVAGFGLFVELLDSFISGGVPVADLTDDYYEIDEKNHRLLGKRSGRKIGIGDIIRVRVAAVHIERRRIDFALA